MILSGMFAHYGVLAFSERGYLAVRVALWTGIAALALLALIPRRRVYVATNVLVVLGSLFLAIQFARIHLPPREAVAIDLPLAGEWYVVHGGRSALVNGGHYLLKAQRDALDLVRLVDGRTHEGSTKQLTSYAAFGQRVLAPADGLVTFAEDGLADERIGESDAVNPLGNNLVVDIGDGRYVMLAHLRRGSIRVVRSERVRRGQRLADVGNSGQSDEPHLHLQIQNEPSFDIEQSSFNKPWYLVTNTVIGVGSLRTYPILFRDGVLIRGGEESRPAEADVRRNDRVRRIPR